MLDQNTDRMWYVIGAVIIGAAIILIMNNTFPQLFASIGGTFQDKTEDVGKVVDDLTMTDGIGPVRNENLIEQSTVTNGYIMVDGTYRDHLPEQLYLNRTTDYIDVSELSDITVTLFDTISPTKLATRPSDFGRIYGYDASKQPVRAIVANLKWTTPNKATLDVSDVQYIRANLLLQDEYRYKIEAGKRSTAY